MASLRWGRKNFLEWDIGFVQRWPIRIREGAESLEEGARSTGRPLRRWVTVEQGRDLVARFEVNSLTLGFNHRAHEREVRAWLHDSPEPYLAAIELTDLDVDEPEGELVLSRTALPGALSGKVYVVLADHVFPTQRPVAPGTSGWRETFARSLVLNAENALHLVAETSKIGGLDTELERQVTLHTNTGGRLTCIRHDGPTGGYLEAIEYVTEGLKRARDARLMAIDEPPEVIAQLDGKTDGCAVLRDLVPASRVELTFWIQYSEQQVLAEKEGVKRRRDNPLEYDDVGPFKGKRRGFDVRILDPSVAELAWLEKGAKPSRGLLPVGVAVLVHSADGTEKLKGTLVAFEPDRAGLRASLRMEEASAVPPPMGKLFGREDKGDVRQRERRLEALQRLRTGTTANPELLAHLLSPERVPRVRGPNRSYKAPPGAVRHPAGDQLDAVLGAAKCPPLFVIQGPPGTGKTFVITKIIEQLMRRFRNREEDGEHRPIRILLASIQRVAVANVAERLQSAAADTLVYEDRLYAGKEGAAKARQRGEDIALDVRHRLQGAPEVARVAALQKATDELEIGRREVSLAVDHATLQAALDRVESTGTPDVLGTEALASGFSELRDELRQVTEASAETRREDPGVAEGAAGVLRNAQEALGRVDALVGQTSGDPAAAWENLALASAALLALGMPQRLVNRLPVVRARVTGGLLGGRLPRALEEYWQRYHEEFSSALADVEAHGSGQDMVSPAGEDERFLAEALAWFERAEKAVADERTFLAETETAILWEWANAIEREPGTLRELERDYASVVAATCSRSAPRSGQDLEGGDFYDIAIVDEAGRAGIDLLIPMTLARTTILVGDHLQLPPYVEEQLVRRIEQDVLDRVDDTRSLFLMLRKRLPPTNFVVLRRQYRMHEDIGRVVSRAFYEPDGIRLEHHYSDEHADVKRPCFGLLGDQPLAWVDTADVARNRPRPPKYRNPLEEEVILALLRAADQDALAAMVEDDGPVVGVLSFYGDQKDLLERAIGRLPVPLRSLVEVGTVDSYQGREFPLVILSCVRSNDTGAVGFLGLLPQRINVAMSRAQRQLIIVGDASTICHPNPLRGSRWLRDVYHWIRDGDAQGRIVDSAEVLDEQA